MCAPTRTQAHAHPHTHTHKRTHTYTIENLCLTRCLGENLMNSGVGKVEYTPVLPRLTNHSCRKRKCRTASCHLAWWERARAEGWEGGSCKSCSASLRPPPHAPRLGKPQPSFNPLLVYTTAALGSGFRQEESWHPAEWAL